MAKIGPSFKNSPFLPAWHAATICQKLTKFTIFVKPSELSLFNFSRLKFVRKKSWKVRTCSVTKRKIVFGTFSVKITQPFLNSARQAKGCVNQPKCSESKQMALLFIECLKKWKHVLTKCRLQWSWNFSWKYLNKVSIWRIKEFWRWKKQSDNESDINDQKYQFINDSFPDSIADVKSSRRQIPAPGGKKFGRFDSWNENKLKFWILFDGTKLRFHFYRINRIFFLQNSNKIQNKSGSCFIITFWNYLDLQNQTCLKCLFLMLCLVNYFRIFQKSKCQNIYFLIIKKLFSILFTVE